MQLQKPIDRLDEIPDHWYNAKIKSFMKIKMGQSPPSETYNDQKSGLPFFQGVSDFGDINPKTRIWCSEPIAIATNNQILLSVRAPVGEVNLANFDCCIGRGLAALEPIDSDLKYCFYLLKHFNSKFLKTSQGTTFEAINRGDISNIIVPFTNSFKEQEKIGLILSTADELMQKTDQIINQMQRLKKGLMQKLLTKGIGHTSFKTAQFKPRVIRVEIPNRWKFDILKNLLSKNPQNGLTIKSALYGSGYLIIEIEALYQSDSVLKQENLRRVPLVSKQLSKYRLVNNDFVANRVSKVKSGAGKLVLVKEPIKDIVYEGNLIRFRINEELVIPEFFEYLSKSSLYFNYMQSVCKTLSLTSIDQDIIFNIPVLLPSKNEQEIICNILSSLDLRIANYYNLRLLLRNKKKGLMQKLLTGQIRVKV